MLVTKQLLRVMNKSVLVGPITQIARMYQIVFFVYFSANMFGTAFQTVTFSHYTQSLSLVLWSLIPAALGLWFLAIIGLLIFFRRLGTIFSGLTGCVMLLFILKLPNSMSLMAMAGVLVISVLVVEVMHFFLKRHA